MPDFADFRLDLDALARYGLPDITYSIPVTDLHLVGSAGGDLPLAAMLYGLQSRASDGNADWHYLEAAIDRLASLMAPPTWGVVVTATRDGWWLEIGPVDRDQALVTIQRGELLMAAIACRDDGRLRVAGYRPLDAKSAEYLIGLAQTPDPEHGVCMRQNNWQYALDCSAGQGNAYATDRGEAYLSYWEKGIGCCADGSEVAAWRSQNAAVARQAAVVATEIDVYGRLSVQRGAGAEQ